jgi:hypothetical protein
MTPTEERRYKAARRKLFESFNGCDCDPSMPRQDRCAVGAIRCNGRMRVYMKRLADLDSSWAAPPSTSPEGPK